jgi:hypothetical protein
VEGYTLFICKSIHDSSMCRDLSSYCSTSPQLEPQYLAGPDTPPTYAPQCRQSHHHHMHARLNIELEAPWIDVHTLVVEGYPFLQRVVVRSSWFSRSENIRSRSTRRNKQPHPNVEFHTSLTPHSSHIKYIYQVSCASQYSIINEPCINSSPRI